MGCTPGSAWLGSAEHICLTSGLLPGRKQTAYRAEIFAVIHALAASKAADIYTDCFNVYRGFLHLQTKGWVELDWVSSPDRDLWRTLWRLLSEDGRQHSITWIRAHRHVHEATGSTDLWHILQNRAVDSSADVNKHRLPPAVEAVRQELHEANKKVFAAKLDTAKYIRLIWDLHHA